MEELYRLPSGDFVDLSTIVGVFAKKARTDKWFESHSHVVVLTTHGPDQTLHHTIECVCDDEAYDIRDTIAAAVNTGRRNVKVGFS